MVVVVGGLTTARGGLTGVGALIRGLRLTGIGGASCRRRSSRVMSDMEVSFDAVPLLNMGIGELVGRYCRRKEISPLLLTVLLL